MKKRFGAAPVVVTALCADTRGKARTNSWETSGTYCLQGSFTSITSLLYREFHEPQRHFYLGNQICVDFASQ